jgi:hypothetical protein
MSDVQVMGKIERFLHDNPHAEYQQVTSNLNMESISNIWICDWILFCMSLSRAGKLEKTLKHLNPELTKPAQPYLFMC